LLINGKSENFIDAADRGLQYGDGLFETLAVVGGRPCLWHLHMQRLSRGCERLKIPFPGSDQLLHEVLQELGSTERAVVKIILTRGCGGRGYRPPAVINPNRMVFSFPWPGYPQDAQRDGVKVGVCSTRLGLNPGLAGLKTLNRLEQVLAQSEWKEGSVAEGLMLDTNDHVIEGTMSNLFLLRGGILITPDLSHCGTAGVMRELIIDTVRRRKLELKVGTVGLDDLREADGLFLSNSLIGIWPVRELAGRTFDPRAIDPPLVNEVLERGFQH
jgi:4-amino-4-deoxychorismate lyase